MDSVSDGRVTTRDGQCVRREGDYKRWIVCQTGGCRLEDDYKRWTVCQAGG